MGVETDFVLATPDQADAVLASNFPSRDFPGVYAKGTDPISLSALQVILTGSEPPDDVLEDYPEVATEPSGEKSVVAVPTPLRLALRSLPDSEVEDVVSTWMETDEFMLTGWDAEIAADFLLGMKRLLATEGADRKELWMTMSS